MTSVYRLRSAIAVVAAVVSGACGSTETPGTVADGTAGQSAAAAAGAPTTSSGGATSIGGATGSNVAGSSAAASGAAASGAAGSGDAAGGISNSGGAGTDTAGGSGGSGLTTGGASSGGASAAGGAGAGGVDGNVVSLFDGTTLSGWLPSTGTGVGNAPALWNVQDSALHCTGTVRGTLISAKDYGNFRLIFDVRQLPSTGTDNHYASVLIWGTRPPPNDAIGGVQFGTPNGYYWDYRPGHNDSGAKYFVSTSGGFSRTAWARCEILAQTATGIARMACCNLGTATTCKAKEVLKFTDPTAGKTGPIALQAHSPGSHDEYNNITIEENPTVNALITTM